MHWIGHSERRAQRRPTQRKQNVTGRALDGVDHFRRPCPVEHDRERSGERAVASCARRLLGPTRVARTLGQVRRRELTYRAQERDDDRTISRRFILGEAIAEHGEPALLIEARDVAMQRRGLRRDLHRGIFSGDDDRLATHRSKGGICPDFAANPTSKAQPQAMVVQTIFAADFDAHPWRVCFENEPSRELSRPGVARSRPFRETARHTLQPSLLDVAIDSK